MRYGILTSETADIEGVTSKLLNEINIGYKYIDEGSCTLEEGGHEGIKGCVGGSGWRQLLRFTSSSVNVGKTELHLGDVKTDEYLSHGVYEWDPCHKHYHFQHYENYLFGNVSGRKTGFYIFKNINFFHSNKIKILHMNKVSAFKLRGAILITSTHLLIRHIRFVTIKVYQRVGVMIIMKVINILYFLFVQEMFFS